MAKPVTKTEEKTFTPTFRTYASMNQGEQDAFRQGAKTVENKVKTNLGLVYKKKPE